jgi:hypothetical protein
VLSFLEPPQLLVVAQVCRRMNEAASSDRLWSPVADRLGEWFVGAVTWMRGEAKKKANGKVATVKDRCRAQVLPRLGEIVQKTPGLVPLKIVILGDHAAGKTWLQIRLVDKTFPAEVCLFYSFFIVLSLTFTVGAGCR